MLPPPVEEGLNFTKAFTGFRPRGGWFFSLILFVFPTAFTRTFTISTGRAG